MARLLPVSQFRFPPGHLLHNSRPCETRFAGDLSLLLHHCALSAASATGPGMNIDASISRLNSKIFGHDFAIFP
jgi:hypothetical protein